MTLWVVFTVVFMGARLVVLLHRARGDAWLVTGTLDLSSDTPTALIRLPKGPARSSGQRVRGRPSRRRNGP